MNKSKQKVILIIIFPFSLFFTFSVAFSVQAAFWYPLGDGMKGDPFDGGIYLPASGEPPPESYSCSFTASPTSGNPPLTVNFALTYTGTSGCGETSVGWNAPCNPTTGCNYTYNDSGLYGPYTGQVQFFVEADTPEGAPRCVPGPYRTCNSPTINVGGQPPGAGCTLSASPTSGNAPLAVSFNLSYASDPLACNITTSWNVPCNPTSGCNNTFSSPGTYGPYSATVSYYRRQGASVDPELNPCLLNRTVSCQSSAINVGTGPSPTPTPTPPVPPPFLEFNATPSTIVRGASSLLEWRTIPDAQTCLGFCVSGDCEEWGPRGMIGANKAVNGSQRVTPLQTSRYGLRCFSATGDQVYKEAPVTVSQVRWREILPRFPLLGPFFARVLR